MSDLDRRAFIRIAGVGTSAFLAGCASSPGLLTSRRGGSNIVVIGAGAFGGWTALNLQRMGAKVTLVDMYGAGNSRSTSGDETRGVRSSYGDRPHGELWMQWARVAMERWKQWDEEYAKPLRMRVFFTTGDVILRSDWEPFLTQTKAWWEKNRIPFEVLTPEETKKRWPVFEMKDIKAVLYEPDAGVVRARRATESVAEVFRYGGGKIVIGRIVPPEPGKFDGHTLSFTNGDTISADTFVFAVGPWLGKTFALMQNRMRTPLGSVFYYGTPYGDQRFTFPNMPSWNYPGTTGWAALPADNRGFRVRGGGGGGQNPQNALPSAAPSAVAPSTPAPSAPAPSPSVTDPDLSSRWVDPDRVQRSRQWLGEHFPDLKDAPLLQTHSCHYESTSSRDFVIDRHPDLPNVWIAGGGNAEAFKQGPVLGEFIAKRILGTDDQSLAQRFRIPANENTPAGRPGEGEEEE